MSFYERQERIREIEERLNLDPEYAVISAEDWRRIDRFLKSPIMENLKNEFEKRYIDVFLDPNSKIEVNDRQIQVLVESLSEAGENSAISEHIRGMKYHDFLKTPYWRIISFYIKNYVKSECTLCSSEKNLVVHHPNYSFHGCEINNMESLVVLCDSCHKKHHNIGV